LIDPASITAAAHLTGSISKTVGVVSLFGATAVRRNGMRNQTYPESAHTANEAPIAIDAAQANSGLPNRLMTVFEVAQFVGCHEETVRRAYQRGLLVSQRFGVRSRRFHPRDVLDWIQRGAPTRIT
jgi:excisionase family DNA binding protein